MRLSKGYFEQDAVVLARDLLGKVLVRQFDNGIELRVKITEVEAYRGEEDLACHASKGRTKRTEVMYDEGGKVYVYLIYGMYWMLNFVCGHKGEPQAVLIRGIESISGPGRVGRTLQLDKTFYGEDLNTSQRLWIEKPENAEILTIETSQRIGVDYAGEEWAGKPWRFFISR